MRNGAPFTDGGGSAKAFKDACRQELFTIGPSRCQIKLRLREGHKRGTVSFSRFGRASGRLQFSQFSVIEGMLSVVRDPAAESVEVL